MSIYPYTLYVISLKVNELCFDSNLLAQELVDPGLNMLLA